MRSNQYRKNSRLILILLIFSFFISFTHPHLVIARESEAERITEDFYATVKRNLRRDLISKQYGKFSSRVLPEHLKIYRNFFAVKTENRSNAFQGSLEAGLSGAQDQALQGIRQGGLFDNIYDPNPHPWLPKIANLFSFGLNFTGPLKFGNKALKFGAARVGVNATLGQFLNFSKDGVWNNPLHRNQQADFFVLDLMEQLDTRKAFSKKFPSALKGWNREEVEFPISSEWRVEGNLVYFQDQEGKDRVFNYKFLDTIEKAKEGKRVTNYAEELGLRSLDELFHYFPEEAGIYVPVENKKLIEGLIDISLAHREGSVQNQEKMKKDLIHLMEEMSKLQVQTNQNGDLVLQLGGHRFVPESLSEIDRAIGEQMKYLEAVESELMNFDLNKKERERLEIRRSLHQKQIENFELQKINRLGEIFQSAVNTGGEAAYFFGRAFNASPKTMRAIDQHRRMLTGVILVGTSIARLHHGDAFALASLFQGLNMSLGALEGRQRSIEASIEEMLRNQTDLILYNIREGVHLVVENQMNLHKDLTRRLIDFEARLTTEVRIVGDKVDRVQRFLHGLGDLLVQGIQQIREDISQGNSLNLSRQKDLMETQGEILSHIHSLGEQVSWEIQRTTIQNILNRASGFRELFYYDTSTNIISCREDVSQCTESEKNQMLEIKKLMGELVSHVRTTLRSGESSSPFGSLRKEELSSYLSEKQIGRVEDRLHLFPPILEWLNEHIELSSLGEETVLAVDEDSVSGGSAFEDKVFVFEEILELFTHLPHPDLLHLILDQYVELGNYLPQNEIKVPQGFDGRTYVNRGMDAICKESLKHRKATQKMRELIPLAWKVYRGYLNQVQEVYLRLKGGYKELFYKTIVLGFNEENDNQEGEGNDGQEGEGSESQEGEGSESQEEIEFNPIVKSSLFVEDFSPQEVVLDESASHSEGEKTIPKAIEVSLGDLLFLPESKIEVFVDGLKVEEREELSKIMRAYVDKEVSPKKEETGSRGGDHQDQCKKEEGCFETSTCEVREWEEVNNPEPLFPDGKGLTVDFWGPESFEIVKSFDPYLNYKYEKSFKKEDFNCESKGAGHHVLEIYSHKWWEKATRFFGIKLGRNREFTGGTWVHYVCKEVEENFYEKGNRYSGKTWKVEVYKKTNTSSKEKVLSSERWGLNVCSTCTPKNGKRCATVDVIQDAFDIKVGYVWRQKDWPSNFNLRHILHNSEAMGIPFGIGLPNDPDWNAMQNFPATLRYHCDWQKPRRKETCKRFKRGQIVVTKPEISRRELLQRLKDLRWRVLGRFKKHTYSIFSGENIDPSIMEIQEFHQELLRGLSLSKLAFVSLIYGGYGRVFVESPMGFSLYSLIQQMPSGYGVEGMNLLKRFPGDQSFSFVSKTSDTHYAFRGWMSRMDQGFSMPKEIDLKEIDNIFQTSNEGEEIDSTFVLGFGRPAYVHNLLALASTNRNLMMSEECLREHGLSYSPFVLQTQFPSLGSDSVEERVNLAQFVGEKLSTESGGKKGNSILLIQAEDSESSVRREVILSASKLEHEEGLEVLELLALDPDRETQVLVAQTIVDFPVVINKKRKSEVLKTLLGNPEITQETFSLIEKRALKIMGLEGTDGGALSSYSLIFNLSQLGASENEHAGEAIVFLNALFNSVDFKPIEDRLIHLGLLQRETKKEENDFYHFFQKLLELGVSGHREAILLFDLLIQYIEKNGEKRKRMVDLVLAFSIELEQEERLLILSQFVSDEEKDVKVALAKVLGEIGGRVGIQILEELSGDGDQRVRVAVAQGVGNVGDSAGIQILEKLNGDQNSDVRKAVHQAKFTIIKKAGEMGNSEGFQILEGLSSDQNLDIRIAVVQAAGEMGGIAGVRILEKLIGDESWSIKVVLAQVIGEIGDNEGIRILERLIDDEYWYVKAAIAYAAVKIEGRAGFQILEKLSGDQNWYLRLIVAQIVGEMETRLGLRILEKLSGDQYLFVREAVVQATGAMGGNKGIQILEKLSGDQDWYIRGLVAQAAGEMGGSEGFQLLEKLSGDQNSDVRMAVAEAAGVMGGNKGIRILEKLSGDQNSDLEVAIVEAKIKIIKTAGEIGGSEGIQILKKFSDDQDWYIRGLVAQAAGEIGGREGIQILEKMSGDQNSDVRVAVAQAAGKIGDSEGIQILEKLRGDQNSDVRVAVAQAAREREGDEGIRILDELSNDQNERVREAVAWAAGEIGFNARLQILERFSVDQNSDVRVAVAHAAGQMGGGEGIRILEKLSNDQDERVREAVAQAAGEMGGGAGIWILGRLSDDQGLYYIRVEISLFMSSEEQRTVRGAVAQAVGKIGDSEGVWILKKLSSDQNWRVREVVAQAAGEIGGSEGIRILEKLSSDQNWRVREVVAQAVGGIGGGEGIRILEKFIGDQNERVRGAAVQASGEIGGDEGIRILEKLISHQDSNLRKAVVQTAGEIEGGKGIRILEKLIDDQNSDIRKAVAQAAGEIGGSEGIRILENLSGDQNSDVRKVIVQSAGKIGGSEGFQLLEKLSGDENSYVRQEVDYVVGILLKTQGQ